MHRRVIQHALVAFAPVLLLCARAGGVPTQATCYTAFDPDYFYFAAVVRRPGFVGSSVAPFSNPYTDDGIAILLTTEDRSRNENSTGRRVEMAVSVAGGAQLYRGAARTPLSGFDEFLQAPDGARLPFKYRLRVLTPVGTPSDDNGFSVEVAIPWVELGGAPLSGARMRMNVCVFGPDGTNVACLDEAAASIDAARSPDAWPEIVFVDAPVRSVATAPDAKVCARVYNVKPVVDGAVAEGEWSPTTSFAFGRTGPDRPDRPVGMPAVSRVPAAYQPTPAVALRPVRAAGPADEPVVLSRQPWPKLVMTRYIVDYQADPRKSFPHTPVAELSGRSTLVTHPMDGTGPWLTYDRVDWHRIQFMRMSEAGIHAAALVRDIRDHSFAATASAATACAALDAASADRPSLCLWLKGAGSETAADVYDAIARFCYAVPEIARTRVPLAAANGGGYALPVVLELAADLTEQGVRDIRTRYRQAFGDDLMLIAAEDEVSRSGFAGVLSMSPQSGDGVLSVRLLSAGATSSPGDGHLLAVRNSNDYRAAWKQALAAPPDWVVINSWNDFRRASEVAPTTEYGVEYLDATRALTALFCDVVRQPLRIVRHTLPAQAAVGSTQAIALTVCNDGPTPWTPDAAAIRVRSSSGPSRAATLRLPRVVEPGDVVTVAADLAVGGQPGVDTLEIELVRVDKRGAQLGWTDKVRAVRTLPLRLISAGADIGRAFEANVLSESLPARMETGSPYDVRLQLRNDGTRVWPKGSTVVGRLFEPGDHANAETIVLLAGASATLPIDVAPGAKTDVRVQLAACRPDGTPLVLSADSGKPYLVRWDVVPPAPAEPAACSPLRSLEVVDADFGVRFINDYTPAQLPGGKRAAVAIGVRNDGPQAWAKDGVRIGYHWYSQDGLELVWEDETVALPGDLAPGSEISDVRAWVTAPAEDGIYWLVWDVRFGDTWASTRTSARAYDSRVRVVEVINGSLSHVNLAPAANRALCAPLAAPLLSGIDPSGRLLPAEITPPFAGNSPVASTLWLPETRRGAERSRRLSFRWLSRTGPNAVQCAGQRITVATARQARVAARVHILAASVRAGSTVGVTLHFADGSEQYTSFPVSSWDGQPLYGETIAAAFPYTRLRADGSLGPGASIYHYAIRVKEPKGLVGVSLSDAPDVCVAAITIER